MLKSRFKQFNTQMTNLMITSKKHKDSLPLLNYLFKQDLQEFSIFFKQNKKLA